MSARIRPKPPSCSNSSAPAYERRSTLITASQPFGEWGKVFPDAAMTLAAVDRLVHHATIFEINVDSYRRRAALERKQKGAGRPPNYATIKDISALSLSDNQTQTQGLRPTITPNIIPSSRSPIGQSRRPKLPTPRAYSNRGQSSTPKHSPGK